MSWKKYKLGDILKRRRETVKILPNDHYKLVTIKLYHKGVILREISKGSEIKSAMSIVHDGDFILSGIDARNGAFGIVPAELDGAVVTNDFWCLDPDENLIDKAFLLFLTGTQFFDYICKQSSDGTTQRIRLQKDKFFNYEIDLPSVVEQRMLVKRLKAIGSTNVGLSTELIHQLDLVEQLRQAFLREAMQGKLVAQDPYDEPASELLKKIKAERGRLIKENKIKKDKKLSPIKPEEVPYDIPENWVWCRLGEICIINPRTKAEENTDAGFIPMPLVHSKYGARPDFKIRKWKEIKSGFTHFANGDVVVAKITPCFENSKAGIMKDLPNGIGAGTTELHVLRGNKYLKPEFIYSLIKTETFLKKGESIMRGVAGQQRVPTDYFYSTLIPLSPLSEQDRIVAKLEKLMHYCNQLEQSIHQSQALNEQLLQHVLREALRPKEEHQQNNESNLAAELR